MDSFPTPTITGQGLADSYTPQIVINGQNLQLVVSTGVNHPSTSIALGSSENPSGFNDSISFTTLNISKTPEDSGGGIFKPEWLHIR